MCKCSIVHATLGSCDYDMQNTYSTTLAVAEKAALIIAEELGIKGV